MIHPSRSAFRRSPRAVQRPRAVSRRSLLGVAASLPAVGVLAACSGGEDEPEEQTPDGPPDEVTFLTGFGIAGRHSYAHIAEAKGYFAEENLAVTIEPGEGGVPSHQALVSGAAHFAAIDSTGGFQRWADGDHDVVIISAVEQLPLSAIITYEDTGITSPADLEGRTIAGQAGAIIEGLFPAFAQVAGFDPTTVTFEHLAPPQIPAALAAEQVDAAALFVTAEPSVAGIGEGRETVVFAYGDYLTDLYGTVIVAQAAMVEENPDLVRRFNNAVLRGLEYAVANPEECGQIMHEMEPSVDPDVAAAELAALHDFVYAGLSDDEPVGVMYGSRTANSVALLQSIGYVDDNADLINDQGIMAWDVMPYDGRDE